MKTPLLNPEFIAAALGLKIPSCLQNEASRPFSVVTTDSRKIKPGALFVALKGDKFDGHSFIDTAIAQGVSAVLCRKDHPIKIENPSCGIFSVEDTLQAYRQLASQWRKQFKIPVVAIAGSVGKTTTKEILASILRGRWQNLLKTQGSQNGYIGIPMTLLDLNSSHGVAVIEVGIDEIGAMAQHMPLVDATATVLTAIGPEHLERLIDVPTVAHEEGLALEAVAKTNGLIAINLDDPWISPHYKSLKGGKKIGYTLKSATDNSILSGEVSADGLKIKLSGCGINGKSFLLPLPGVHNAANFMGAVTLAVGLGLSCDEIEKGLLTFQRAEGRSDLNELPGGIQVICDYYNANPSSTEAGLALLTDIASRRGYASKRWACLADMLELGADEEKFHRGLASKIIGLKVENVLLYGPRMQWLESELKAQGFTGHLNHFDTHRKLADSLSAGVKNGDAVLIKGSRGMKMEEVWKPFKEMVSKKP